MDKWSVYRSLPDVVDPPGSEAAVLVPLYEDLNGDIRVILTRRPDHMSSHPGDVVFPGGHREGGEEPIATATREAWEEIRLPPENVIEVLGGLEPVTTRNRTKPIVPVVVRIDRPEKLVADPAEVDVIIEPRMDDMLDESGWVTRPWFGHTLWFYEFDEGILWGATAFMMRDLLAHVRSQESHDGRPTTDDRDGMVR
jgi:8-oxo-dGTP pyrophosphatase MutT (NUDIX family)